MRALRSRAPRDSLGFVRRKEIFVNSSRVSRGLLRSYLSFARDDEETPASARQGWIALRGWLFTQFGSLSKQFLHKTRMREGPIGSESWATI